MIIKILSNLIFSANTNPVNKFWFYGIKDRVLKRFGERVAYDQQHIIKWCWSCDGSGIFRGFESGYFYKSVPPQTCYKCNGSGVYYEFWVLLEVWKLGKYEFHKPLQRIVKGQYFTFTDGTPLIFNDFRNKIEGLIKHEPHQRSEFSFWILSGLFTPLQFLKYWKQKTINKISMPFWKIQRRYQAWKFQDDDIPF